MSPVMVFRRAYACTLLFADNVSRRYAREDARMRAKAGKRLVCLTSGSIAARKIVRVDALLSIDVRHAIRWLRFAYAWLCILYRAKGRKEPATTASTPIQKVAVSTPLSPVLLILILFSSHVS